MVMLEDGNDRKWGAATIINFVMKIEVAIQVKNLRDSEPAIC